MNRKCINKLIITCFLCMSASKVLADEQMRWFKNELVCTDTKVMIRSYCRNEVDQPVNNLCTKQILTLEKSSGKSIRRNLLAKEPSRGYFHVVGLLRCVVGDSKPYLYLSFENGGNCNRCETQGIMDLDGNWKRYGEQWYSPLNEREDIARHQNNWFKQEPTLLKNKIED